MAEPKIITSIKDLQNGLEEQQETIIAHQSDYVNHPGVAITTNSGNAYAITLNSSPTAYINGMGLVLTINADSTGAATINVNGLGVIPILKSNGNAVTNLKANGVYTLRYSNGNFILQGEGGSGNLKPNQALAGFTFANDDGEQVGTGDPNLVPGNIISGATIFGVTGNSANILAHDVGEVRMNTFPFAASAYSSDLALAATTMKYKCKFKTKVRIKFKAKMNKSSTTGYAYIFFNNVHQPQYNVPVTSYITNSYSVDVEVPANTTMNLTAYLGNDNRIDISDCFLYSDQPVLSW